MERITKEDLLERTRFYQGEEKPLELLDTIEMASLYWDYESVWVKMELNPDDFYKETVAYFQRTFHGIKVRTDIPIGLQAISPSAQSIGEMPKLRLIV